MKALFLGLAASTLLGLAAGGAMKPSLNSFEGPAGPQMLAPVSGYRARYETSTGAASWTGPVPEYVIGTDWVRATATVELAPSEPEREIPDEDLYVPPDYFEFTAYEEPDRAPVTIPSMGGGVLVDSPPPLAVPPPEQGVPPAA